MPEKSIRAQKKYEFRKKRNSYSYFYGPKKYGSKKKELIVFRANILPKKVWVPKQSMMSSFFLELILFLEPILFLALCCALKKYEFLFFWNSDFFWHFFFLAPILFFGTIFGPQKYEFLFCGTNIFLLNPYFFWRNVWPGKMRFPFCWSPHFFGRMFGLNMYEVAFFPGTLSFLKCYVLMKYMLGILRDPFFPGLWL